MYPKWFQSKCIKALLPILSLALATSGPLSRFAVAKPVRPPLPRALQEVESKYARAKTLSADFTQTNENPASLSSTPKISKGKIWIKRPSKVRWETTQPDASLLVSNGKKFWHYTPPFDEGEHGQLIEKNAQEVQSTLANALLAGEFSVQEIKNINALGSNRFALEIKPGSAGTVKTATIEMDPVTKLIKKVELSHQGGRKTEITLDHIQLGISLDDKLFAFSAPKNTDVLRDQDLAF